jgi:hypothetical protein
MVTTITTIRNLDPVRYRQIKARAALEGRPVGEVVSEAIAAYVMRPRRKGQETSLADLQPEEYPKGTTHLSEEVDHVLYGRKR